RDVWGQRAGDEAPAAFALGTAVDELADHLDLSLGAFVGDFLVMDVLLLRLVRRGEALVFTDLGRVFFRLDPLRHDRPVLVAASLVLDVVAERDVERAADAARVE